MLFVLNEAYLKQAIWPE